MIALQILAAWIAASIATGFVIARCIPPSEDGEGLQGRGENKNHNGVIGHD